MRQKEKWKIGRRHAITRNRKPVISDLPEIEKFETAKDLQIIKLL
jgi:hypothetical protein